jgi:hypothetical protein
MNKQMDMTCPHCFIRFEFLVKLEDFNHRWELKYVDCPNCGKRNSFSWFDLAKLYSKPINIINS